MEKLPQNKEQISEKESVLGSMGAALSAVGKVLWEYTPQGAAEKQMKKSVDNAAAAMALSVIQQTRQWFQLQGIEMDSQTQTKLAESERRALETLKQNKVLVEK
ncbi:MAG: hypothetical protein HY226_05335 [Candidatus Vogelbacteria bacterium]|nr:hypothetical protein [Candidatus Vogelbacteria bacterium]